MPGVIKKQKGERAKAGTLTGEKPIDSPEGLDVISYEAPEFLKDQVARDWYKDNAERLSLAGILKDSDLTTLALAASAFADSVAMIGMLDLARDQAGHDVEALEMVARFQRQKNSQVKSFLEFAKALGLTSVDRGRVRKEEQEEVNPFAEFMAQ